MRGKNRRSGAVPWGPSLTRRQAIGRGAAGAAALYGIGALSACGDDEGGEGGSITIGSFEDQAMVPFANVFLKKYEEETGNKAEYRQTSYDAWYQNAKTAGLQETGAFDIFIMDDNWVPEFAAAEIIQSLDELGLEPNPDILPNGLDQGYWPPKTGPRLTDFEDAEPELFALVVIDDVQMLYYHEDYFKTAPKTWDQIEAAAKKEADPPNLYGWSARGVKGNPIVQTYLPLLNAYGGAFANDDWTPGFAGPEGVGALERLLSFIPVMPAGVAEFDTDQETQVMLQGECMALTEYTGLVHLVDDPKASEVVGKIQMSATPEEVESGPAIGTFIAGIPVGAPNTEGAIEFLEWFTSDETQRDFARQGGNAAVTDSALHDEEAVDKYRWLPAIADAVNNSVPKPRTTAEPKMEDILGTALNRALVSAIEEGGDYAAIAEEHLTEAADEMTAYLEQEGGHFD
jgi:multiple sugar transport system substrate-binding protein